MELIIEDSKTGEEIKVNYEVVRKKVKNINFRIGRDNVIKISLPERRKFSDKDLEKLLLEKKEWIIKVLKKNSKKCDYYLAEDLDEKNNRYFIFGKEYKLLFLDTKSLDSSFRNRKKCDIENISIQDKFIFDKRICIDNIKQVIYINIDEKEEGKKELIKIEKHLFITKLNESCFKMQASLKSLNELRGCNLEVSKLKIRNMKSCWGVCHTKSHEITMNIRLFSYDTFCLDYVMLHELSHLVYTNHSRNFYGLIEKIMPNYKEAIKMLKT